MTKNSIIILLGVFGSLGNFFGNIDSKTSIIVSGGFLVGMWILALFFLKRSMKKESPFIAIFLVGLVLFILEIVGAQTGIIYGDFVYNTLIPFQIFGTPIAMLGIWGFLVYEWYILFSKSKIKKNIPLHLGLSALGVVCFDLVIDPGAAHMGLWYWSQNGAWYGIPFSNFIGWFVMGSLGALLYWLFLPKTLQEQNKDHTMVVTLLSLSFWTSYHFLNGYIFLGFLGILLTLGILYVQKNNS
jgi:bisanhydrobacterioruberin hydratase